MSFGFLGAHLKGAGHRHASVVKRTFLLLFVIFLLTAMVGVFIKPVAAAEAHSTITNGILKAVIENALNDSIGIGVFTIKTDGGHPNPGQNVFYGGAIEYPWTSFTTIRVEDTHREYVTSNSTKAPSSGYTVQYLNAYSPVVTKVSNTTATISWTTAEKLLVTLLIDIRGTTIADTMVQVTVTVQNEDTISHSVAVRHEWDLMIDGDDNSSVRVWTDPSNPQSWIQNETDWISPSFQFWETTNNPDTSVFSIYGSTVLPSVNPPPTVPDRVVYASWASCFGTAYDFKPSGTSGSDSAVLYYWNASQISPGTQISRTAYLTTVVGGELVAFARSTDSAGNLKSTFSTSDSFYVRGQDFPSNTNATIYLIPDGESALPANAVASVSATTSSTGGLPVTLAWSPTITSGHYDIWVDANQNQVFDAGDVCNNQAGGIYAFSVVVDSTKPVANAGPDQTVNEDTQVTFNGSASTDNVGIASYIWIFTDGTPQTLTGKNPTYVFATPGTYTATLNVTDTDGNWATDTVVITVSRVTQSDGTSTSGTTTGGTELPAPKQDATKPVANAGPDKAVIVGKIVSFGAGDSNDNIGIVSYEWDFGDGTNGTGRNVTHTYNESGTYTVTLTVKDAAGNSQTDSMTITVQRETDESGAPAVTDTGDDNIGKTQPQQLYVVAVAVGGFAAATVVALVNLGGLAKGLDGAISKMPIPEKVKEFLQLYGEKLFETVDKAKLEVLEKGPFIARGEIVAFSVSAFLAMIVFGTAEANGLQNFLTPTGFANSVPSALASACIVLLVGELFEALCARTCKIYRQFKLWMYGTIVFLISGLLFQLPFGSPGITRYQSGEISNKTKGLLVLSKMLLLLALAIPFAGLLIIGFDYIGDIGLKLTLMTVFFSLLPLRPLAGKAIFDYRKEISLTALIATGILFYSYATNLLTNITYLAAGVVSAFLAAIAIIQMRKTKPK